MWTTPSTRPHRPRWWPFVVLWAVGLACSVTLGRAPTQGEPAALLTAAGPPATAQPPADTPGPALPFALPGLQPTPLPTRAVTPAAGAPTPALPAGPVLAAEVWDFPSGPYAQPVDGVYYAAGGDVYATNLYERPFPEQSQDAFYPDLDIRYARLLRTGDWFVATIRLHGLPQGGTAPAGDYGIELDTDLDGRGEYLVWATGPVPAAWTPAQVQVRVDAHPDVEGPTVCRSDAPLQGDGYEQVRYTADAATGLAWLRWDWDTEGARRYPAVHIAFHRSLLDGHDATMLWLAWADAGLRQPGQMTYHDAYTRRAAGAPYARDPDFPIRAIARVDNTCRAAFGFTPTGLEPCLCRHTSPGHLCVMPEHGPTPPPDGICENDPRKPDIWVCLEPIDEENHRRFYCVWDPELCQWQCRTDEYCLPPSPDEAQRRFEPITTMNPQPQEACYQYEGHRCPTAPHAAGNGIAGAIDVGNGGVIIYERQDAAGRYCTWDAYLCRWVCRDDGDQCPQPEVPPYVRCEPAEQDAWHCRDATGEFTCRWNARTCRWDCGPAQCTLPDQPPGPTCETIAQGKVRCTSEVGPVVCVLDAQLCRWDCQVDACAVPDASCHQDAAADRWVCPGKGEFAGCEWSTEQCRWVCWDPFRPDPGGDQDEQCQSEDFCTQQATNEWYCEDDTGPYESCTYDGCRWHCE